MIYAWFRKFHSVFDVDIGDGEPIRKLPYNLSGLDDLKIWDFFFNLI